MANIRLIFKFANHDNSMAPVELSVLDSILVKDLKNLLIDKWPSTLQRPPSTVSYQNICLISMGRPLEENLSLKANKVPSFEWPTPVHVAIKGGVMKQSQSSVTNPAVGGGGGGASSTPQMRAFAPPPDSNDTTCSCVIS